jgi:hypothetical protein
MIGANSEIDSGQIPEAPERQTTARQERQGEGKFGDDQQPPRISAAAA